MVRMDEEEKQKWLEAGKITRKALEHGKKKISPDKTLLEVAEAVENKINEQGAETAFPVNLSLNEEAAHYTPEAEDDKKFGESIVKLDVGAQVDGYIGDCARTIDLTNENKELVKASEEALENAIEMVEPGAKTREIGAKIEETIESHGFKPIKNLSGHVMVQGIVHTGLTIPNYNTAGFELQEDMVIAIEPFATKGRGKVSSGSKTLIFGLKEEKPVRNQHARKILELAKNYEEYPFAERWLTKAAKGFKLKAGLKELVQKEVFTTYPVLKAKDLVSQTENTVIVTEDGCEITTKL